MLAGAFLSWGANACGAARWRPRVWQQACGVAIFADDQGEHVKSPRLDQRAKEGTWFADFHVPAAGLGDDYRSCSGVCEITSIINTHPT